MLPRTNSRRSYGRERLALLITLSLIAQWLYPALLISAPAASAAPSTLQATPTPTPSPTPPAAFEYTRLVMTTGDLVYDAQSKNILASVPRDAATNSNSITRINPETAAIGTSVFIGGNPNQMAVSGDNLYVGLDEPGAVGRFHLNTLTPELQFSLGSNSRGLLRAQDLAALPGMPNSIAVVRGNNDSSASIAVYDDGSQRPQTITTNSGQTSTFIESGASADRLYALDSKERTLKTVSVTNQGVSVVGEADVPRADFPIDFSVAEGRAYFTNGDVMDLSTGKLLGRFPGIFNTQDYIYRLVEPDPDKGLVYFLYSDISTAPTNVKIEAFDINTFQPRGSIFIPYLPGPPSSLIRWGKNGLAFRTSQTGSSPEPAQVFLIRTSLIPSDEVLPAKIKVESVTLSYDESVNASFRIARLGDISSKATVQYATSDGTAKAGSDYTAASGTITFEPGETRQNVTVLLNKDTVPEDDETFNFTLSNPTAAALATPSTVEATIIDDDGKPSVQVTASSLRIGEPPSGVRELAFTFSLSAPSTRVVTMDYFTVEGTAQAGSDYAGDSGTLTFNPGETSKTVVIQIKSDDFSETFEFFTLYMRNLKNVRGSSAHGLLVFILDEPTISLSAGSYSFGENIYAVERGYISYYVVIQRSGDDSAPATVQYETVDQSGNNECDQVTGYASQRCDYTMSAGTLTFAAGESSKWIRISVISDGYAEGDESFSIRLKNPTGAIFGAPTQASITIEDTGVVTTPANNPYLGNKLFVGMNYLDFLWREPDQAGLADWTNVLNDCGPEKGFLGAPRNCDRAHVAHGFIASKEFTEKGYFAYRFYEAALSRLPRYSEFVTDMTALSGAPDSYELGQNATRFAEDFISRQEFKDKYADVSEPSQAEPLIARLEQNAGVSLPATATTLPGQPPQYGRQELINLRASGAFTLGQTLRAFIEQKVVYDRLFERGFVTMQYFGFLKRDPDLNDPNLTGWKEWVFVFTNGGAQRGRPDILPRDYHHLTFGFIYSEEYRKRFGQP